MKIFWIFTIRKRIKKRLINTVKEEAFFKSAQTRKIHSGEHDFGNYLGSRIEIKREVANMLRALL